MTRIALTTLALFALTACDVQVPDSGRGVGFESYAAYMARRDQQTGIAPALPPGANPPPVAMANPSALAPEPVSAQPLSAMGTGPAPMPGQLIGAPLATTPLASGAPVPAPQTPARGGGISDEQNFDAVAQRETIQSNAARIEQNRAQYVVVQPTALPTRTGDSGPNIVQYAVSTNHAPGTKLYSRVSLFAKNYEAACAQFGSADAAQMAFLSKGGPQRDSLGVDPDGDGFACGWDPRPFRVR